MTNLKRQLGLFSSPPADSGDMEAMMSPCITRDSWIIRVTRSLVLLESISLSEAKSIKDER